MNTPKLSFKSGKFIFEVVGDETPVITLDKVDWSWIAPRTYETTSLRAAVVLRSFADEVTEKLLSRALQESYELPELPSLPGLEPHQQAGLLRILKLKRTYMAHCAGAGKTGLAVLAAMLSEGAERYLFIVPPTLTKNWETEIKKFADWLWLEPDTEVVPAGKDISFVRWGAPFLVVSDTAISNPAVNEMLRKRASSFIAVDEASRLKESTSQRSVAFYGGRWKTTFYFGLYKDARHVVFLDGSPMPNRPMELWAPTYALDPEAIDCKSQHEFGVRYCGPTIDDRGRYEFKYSSNEEELRAKLQKRFMHVVTEDELPKKPNRHRSMVMLNEDARSNEHREWERKNIASIAWDEVVEADEDEATQGNLARFRRELGTRKIPLIVEFVKDRMKTNPNEKILLFAWHREVCLELNKLLYNFGSQLVFGGTTDKARESAFDAFRNDKDFKILTMNIITGGRGHNLPIATRAIFGEWSWTDETNKQCEFRGARRGSELATFPCQYLVSPGSMDERQLSAVFTKQTRVKRIIG